MQQDSVDLSLSNAFSIAKLNSIRIKANANMQITVIGHGILAGTYLAEYRDSLK